MILKQVKIFLVAALCILGSFQLVAAVPTAAEKAAAAVLAVGNATTLLKTTTSTIQNAGTYVYSDAIALLLPMSDSIANPIWASCNLVSSDAKQAYLDALVALASALVDARERATPADTLALHDAFDAHISSDDFTMAITTQFKSGAQVAVLTAAAKVLAKPLVKKQDFKSVIALQLTALASAQVVDKTVFPAIADLVSRRLDDDEVVNIIAADGTSTPRYEFQLADSGNNFFDTVKNAGNAGNNSSPAILFDNMFSYENSWPNIRGVIENICGTPLYRDYSDIIDLPAPIS